MNDDLTKLSTEQLLMAFRRLPRLPAGINAREIQRIEDYLAEARRRDAAVAEATAWQPVSDGMVYHYTDNIAAEWNYPAHTESIEFLEVRGNGTIIACGSMPVEDEHIANLPDNIRLCRVVTPASAEQEVDDAN